MIIGNYHHTQGSLPPLNRWLFSIEVLPRPPYLRRCFKPVIIVIAMKVFDHGEPGEIDGKPMKKKGGWWRWVSPVGVIIEIV
jgi:hypothetical protein